MQKWRVFCLFFPSPFPSRSLKDIYRHTLMPTEKPLPYRQLIIICACRFAVSTQQKIEQHLELRFAHDDLY